MSKISDTIEEFIKVLLKDSKSNELQIRRNDLAIKLNCAPSQINYVLSSRFTYDKGYVIESRRGSGGYIIIKKVMHKTNKDRNRLIIEKIGNSITYYKTIELLESLEEDNILSSRDKSLIKIAINDRTLQSVSDKNKIRANILKSMIMVLLN